MTVHGDFFSQHFVNIDCAEEGHRLMYYNKNILQYKSIYLRKIVDSQLKGKHRSCQQVGDLQCQCSAILILTLNKISDLFCDMNTIATMSVCSPHLIVYADTESCVNLVTVDQPTHAHEHQMEIVYS